MATQEQYPSHVKKAYQSVVMLLNASRFDQAFDVLNQIPKEIIWDSVVLLNVLGVTCRGLNQPHASIRAYSRALKLEPANAGTWSNLGNACKDANMIYAAISAHKESIKRSDSPTVTQWHNYGLSLSIAGQHQEAIAAFEHALKLDPTALGIRWDLARAQLYLKRYKDGFFNYQYRWHMRDVPPQRVAGQVWDGKKLGKTDKLFVYSEQGLGDYIQCARYLPLLQKKVKNCVVEVKPELLTLMRSSFPDVEFQEFVQDEVDVKDGYIVSLVDLPHYFSKDVLCGSSGYLSPPRNSSLTEKLTNSMLSAVEGKKVGIVWSGSVTFKRNQYRATVPDWFVDHFNLPGVHLYSLQIGPPAALAEKYPISVLDQSLVPLIKDFADTANVLKHLDLVISTCTSVVHLAGALGVPCWVLLDYSAHWLWGVDQDQSDWYDSVKIFRQSAPGDWRSVFDGASAHLMEWVYG